MFQLKAKMRRFFGEAWFQYAIRDPIPESVSNVRAVFYPIPIVRRRESILIAFDFLPSFERDLQLTGWKEEPTSDPLFSFIFSEMGKRAGVNVGRIYFRTTNDYRVIRVMLDATEPRGCFQVA